MEKDSKKQRKVLKGQNVKGRKCSLALKVGSMVLMIISSGIPIYIAYDAVMDDFGKSPNMADKEEVLTERLAIGIMWFMGISGAAVFGTLQFIDGREMFSNKLDINTSLKIVKFCKNYSILLILLGFVGLIIPYINSVSICWLAFFEIISLVTFLAICVFESACEIKMLEKEKRILEEEKQNSMLGSPK